jgi:hypothetical protein
MDKIEYDETMQMVDDYIANTTPEECYNDLVEAGAKPMGRTEMMKIFNDYLANTTPEQFLAELKECGLGCQSWDEAGVRLATLDEIRNNPQSALSKKGVKIIPQRKVSRVRTPTYRP